MFDHTGAVMRWARTRWTNGQLRGRRDRTFSIWIYHADEAESALVEPLLILVKEWQIGSVRGKSFVDCWLNQGDSHLDLSEVEAEQEELWEPEGLARAIAAGKLQRLSEIPKHIAMARLADSAARVTGASPQPSR